MTRKLMIAILGSVLYCGIFTSAVAVEAFDKRTPQEIPGDQIVPSSPEPPRGDKGFCLIQSDDDNESWFFTGFHLGDGMALYMDPALCGVQDPYPFKITDVHFYLYSFEGVAWPVGIQVNIRDLYAGDKCNGPGDLICSQVYTVDEDSAYPNMTHLDMDSHCCVHGPFFLEILYTGDTDSAYLSPLMTDETTNPADSCDTWAWYFWDTSSGILNGLISGHLPLRDIRLCE